MNYRRTWKRLRAGYENPDYPASYREEETMTFTLLGLRFWWLPERPHFHIGHGDYCWLYRLGMHRG